MQSIKFTLLREYWEYKRLVFIMPALVSGLFFLATIAATWVHDYQGHDPHMSGETSQIESSIDTESSVPDPSLTEESKNLAETIKIVESNEDNFWFPGFYLAAAWLVAIFYALSTLYNDRRDKSILYWKTLPVPEWQTVVVKYVFAVGAFSGVAIVISWLSAAVLMSYSALFLPPEMMAQSIDEMGFSRLVIWPIVAIFIAVPWCAPVFALALFVSAKASKMPLLLLVVSVFLIVIVEGIILGSDYVFGFLYAHTPFALVNQFANAFSVTELLAFYLVDSLLSLVLGLAVAAILMWRTAWLRGHAFDIK